jgi:hypothetical protein
MSIRKISDLFRVTFHKKICKKQHHSHLWVDMAPGVAENYVNQLKTLLFEKLM